MYKEGKKAWEQCRKGYNKGTEKLKIWDKEVTGKGKTKWLARTKVKTSLPEKTSSFAVLPCHLSQIPLFCCCFACSVI